MLTPWLVPWRLRVLPPSGGRCPKLGILLHADRSALLAAQDDFDEGMLRRLRFVRAIQLGELLQLEPAFAVLEDLELIVLIAEREDIDPPGLGADDDGNAARPLSLNPKADLERSRAAGNLRDDLLRLRAEEKDLGDDDEPRLARSLALGVVIASGAADVTLQDLSPAGIAAPVAAVP